MRYLLMIISLCAMLQATLALAGDGQKPGKKEAGTSFYCLDLQAKANHKLDDLFHANAPPGNNLAGLPRGEQTWGGVKLTIGDSYIRLGSMKLADKPDKVEGIKVDRKFAKLHILHATGWFTDEDTIIGEYTVTWEDDISVTIPIVYGKDVRNWWLGENEPEPSRAKVAWKGENEASKARNKEIRLYLTTWENPKPDKKVKTIDFSTTRETQCAPFCVAMTIETK